MTGTQLPSYKDYTDALSFPAITLQDPELKAGQPLKGKRGLVTFAGQFALTAAFLDSKGTKWALRCFSRLPHDIEARYHAVSHFVRHSKTNILVNINYQAEGIRVNNAWYPLCKMEWVEGDTLNRFIEKHQNDPERIAILAAQFVDLIVELKTLGCAHGDLHQANIICDGARLRLVDYDGMFVPEFAKRDMQANELGHPHYQHPKRAEWHFNDSIDNFSAISIYLSLKLLAKDPQRLTLGDELIFTKHDYLAPDQSVKIAWLETHGFARAAAYFRKLCKGDPEKVPPLLEFISSDDRLAGEYGTEQQRKKDYLRQIGASKPMKIQPTQTNAPLMTKPRKTAPRADPRPETPTLNPNGQPQRKAFGPIEDSQSYIPLNGGAVSSAPLPKPKTQPTPPTQPTPSTSSANTPFGAIQQPSASAGTASTAVKPPSKSSKPNSSQAVTPGASPAITPPSTSAAPLTASPQRSQAVKPAAPRAKPAARYVPSASLTTTQRVSYTQLTQFLKHWAFANGFTALYVALMAGIAAFGGAVVLELLAPVPLGTPSPTLESAAQALWGSHRVRLLLLLAMVGGLGMAFVSYPRVLPDGHGGDSRLRRVWRLLTALYVCLPLQDALIGLAMNTPEDAPIPKPQVANYALYMGAAGVIFVFFMRGVWRRVIRAPELNLNWLDERQTRALRVMNYLRFYGLSLCLAAVSGVFGTVYGLWTASGNGISMETFIAQNTIGRLLTIRPDITWLAGMSALGLGAVLYQIPGHRMGIWDQLWLRVVGVGLCGVYVLAVAADGSLPGGLLLSIIMGVAAALVALLPIQRALS